VKKVPSSGPQGNYFTSLQMLSAISMQINRQNSYGPRRKWRTGRREMQSRE
jgi:hypothetical protein